MYGIGKEHSTEYWQSVLRQLIHLSFVRQIIGEYGNTLQLTENAKPILRGEMPLELATPRLSSIVTTAMMHKVRSVLTTKIYLHRLRFLRKQIADKENIPPYIVFNDATLQEMAILNRSATQMLQINGVGTIVLETFLTSVSLP